MGKGAKCLSLFFRIQFELLKKSENWDSIATTMALFVPNGNFNNLSFHLPNVDLLGNSWLHGHDWRNRPCNICVNKIILHIWVLWLIARWNKAVFFRTLVTRRRVAASKGVGKSFGAKFRLRNSKPVFAVKRWRRNFRVTQVMAERN